MGQRNGLVVETGEGSIKTIVFGWGAVALGVGIAIAAVVLSAWLGWALTILSAGTGAAIFCVGVGEGVRRARLGRAAEIAAREQLQASQWKELK